jgi:hypothetical protein
MEIGPYFIMSSDNFAKYGLNERCRVSKERVQDFLDGGLMSQGELQNWETHVNLNSFTLDGGYHRYTNKLSEKLTSVRRSDQSSVIGDIRHSFDRLHDPTTGCKSPMAVMSLFEIKADRVQIFAA